MATLRIDYLNKYDKSVDDLLNSLSKKGQDVFICNTEHYQLVFAGISEQERKILEADLKEAIRAYKYREEHGTYNGYEPEYFNPWWKVVKPDDNS